MSNIGITVMLVILISLLFGMVFAWINSATKQINKLFDEFCELTNKYNKLRDYIFELNSNINKVKKDINQIKGQLFTVDEEGEE